MERKTPLWWSHHLLSDMLLIFVVGFVKNASCTVVLNTTLRFKLNAILWSNTRLVESLSWPSSTCMFSGLSFSISRQNFSEMWKHVEEERCYKGREHAWKRLTTYLFIHSLLLYNKKSFQKRIKQFGRLILRRFLRFHSYVFHLCIQCKRRMKISYTFRCVNLWFLFLGYTCDCFEV